MPQLVSKYILVELKKGKINKAALEQTMQYVDWICKEYAAGDYSRIEAYVCLLYTSRFTKSPSLKNFAQRDAISARPFSSAITLYLLLLLLSNAATLGTYDGFHRFEHKSYQPDVYKRQPESCRSAISLSSPSKFFIKIKSRFSSCSRFILSPSTIIILVEYRL